MSESKILVVTHKKFDDSIVPEGYQVIRVGNAISEIDSRELGYYSDNSGENIADENPYYCELTAQYWAWKNLTKDQVKNIGIVHYRRYFFNYKTHETDWRKDILSIKDADELLNKYKVIMSFLTVKYPGYGTLYKHKPKEEQDKHWIIIEEIIKDNYPEYLKQFEKILYGRYTIWGNMIITSKSIFDSYSEWLFDVLKKYDKKIKDLGEERIPRVDGFLSEYLLLVWMYKNYSPNDILHLEVRNTETDEFVDYQNTIKGKLIRFIRKHYLLLKFARNIRISVLLIKRRDKNR